MNPSYIRDLIMREMRENGLVLHEAARRVTRNLGSGPELKNVVRSVIRKVMTELQENTPWGDEDDTITRSEDSSPWYTGVEASDKHWPAYVAKMKSGSLAAAVDEIDKSTHDIVSRMADPNTPGSKKKGLVLGYVQSGKTANYSGVISKAADAGYQLVIVLAGLHNNLREQTQARLQKDLTKTAWYALTDKERDFRADGNGVFLARHGAKALAVVKKQQNRLGELKKYLSSIPQDVLRRVPILIIDDEADQATPNTKAASEEISRINELLRDIWELIQTGTYIGYTATPFANVFMDPNDDRELYPGDFITSLPKPDGYFGAEELFGKSSVDSQDGETSVIDAVRYVPESDSDELQPPKAAGERADFVHGVPSSLREATNWFIVATAIRRARGQVAQHSSMLVHTTHYTAPHFAMKTVLDGYLKGLRLKSSRGDYEALRESFETEAQACSEVGTVPLPTWDDVQHWIPAVLTDCRIVVDNSESDDRLDYDRLNENGDKIPETVIAVGGGTLSRGLTLEGLVVSYFLRTSSTYDTLLQMGRWFGYRKGYEDLPRIWMPADLRLDFEFLAMVEIELREEIRRLTAMAMTPREIGIRVRSHPGRLAITSRNRLVHATRTNLSFTGTRQQTFIFDTSKAVIEHNQNALRTLLAGKERGPNSGKTAAIALFEGLHAQEIADFFRDYRIHSKQTNMPAEFIADWIEEKAGHTLWNVGVMGLKDQESYPLGTLEVAPDLEIPAVNRAPLSSSAEGEANIKALLSLSDYGADIPSDILQEKPVKNADGYRKLRVQEVEGRGLLIVYVVSAKSRPTRKPKAGRPSERAPMDAPDHMIGLGIVFPGFDQVNDVTDGDFYSVTPDWEVAEADEGAFTIGEDEDPEDTDTLPDDFDFLDSDD